MQEKHINDVLATGKFSSARIVKVLIEEEMGGVTYSIQFTTSNLRKILSRRCTTFKRRRIKTFWRQNAGV
jgi:phosphoribosylamine-glycine ligase